MSRAAYLDGLALFNQRKFFEAHEVLEDVWREASKPERLFLQGLVQVAVAFVHHSRGNPVGCRSVLERARRNLSHYPEDQGGIDLAGLLRAVDAWRQAIDAGTPLPDFPVLRIRND